MRKHGWIAPGVAARARHVAADRTLGFEHLSEASGFSYPRVATRAIDYGRRGGGTFYNRGIKMHQKR